MNVTKEIITLMLGNWISVLYGKEKWEIIFSHTYFGQKKRADKRTEKHWKCQYKEPYMGHTMMDCKYWLQI